MPHRSTPGFLLLIDWIIRRTTKKDRGDIKWTLMSRLEDLDFADDALTQSPGHIIQTNRDGKDLSEGGP